MARSKLLSILTFLIAGAGCTAAPADVALDDEAPEEVAVVAQNLLAGSEWPTAGTSFHIYDPSVGETSPWYFNDHTFFKDPVSGTWHLYGITAPEPVIPLAYDVDDANKFGHATAPSLAGPWTKRPFVLYHSTTPPYNETHLWAPHVIAHNGKYYMFYSGGGPNEQAQEMSLATSTDLYNWTREPTGPLFYDGFQARDPMVIRVGTEWVMYYTATSSPSGGNHVVAYRKSTDLKTWGPRQIAFTDPMTGTDAGPTESPFVIKRGSWYYLFTGPRPYHLYIPPTYPGTDVFASQDPFNFNVTQQVGHIAAHAAEVIDDGTRLWVSDAGWALGGVYLAPLDFHSAPVSGTKLYSRSSNGDVKRWSGAGQTWTTIGNSSSKLVTGGFGTFSVRTNGNIYRYDTQANTWTQVGGARTAFAVNAIGLYARDAGGVYKWSGSQMTWHKIYNSAVNAIYAGGNELYATFSDGNFYRYTGDGTNASWLEIGGPGDQYVANTNGVYGRSVWGVFQWTGVPDEWVQIGGAADMLYAGGNALYATVPFFGTLNYYRNSPDTWESASSAATSFAVCDDALYAQRSTGVFKKNGASWTQVGPAVSSIACGK